MILQLDMAGEIPLYQQIRNQVVLAMGRGELRAGNRLPTVRQLAEDVGINTMTVNKAYALLKSEGYIEIDRRHGAMIRSTNTSPSQLDEAFKNALFLLAAEAKAKGIERDAFLAACREAVDCMASKGAE